MMEMPPLPPYIYGRETGRNERVYTEQAIREHGELCARMAREEERERCAKVAETTPLEAFCSPSHFGQRDKHRADTAAAIRSES